MNLEKFAHGFKRHVLTPAARGAVQGVLGQFRAPDARSAGGALAVSTLIGFGVVIGASVALLLTPVTGKELRARLMGLASKLAPSKGQDDASDEDGDTPPGECQVRGRDRTQ